MLDVKANEEKFSFGKKNQTPISAPIQDTLRG